MTWDLEDLSDRKLGQYLLILTCPTALWTLEIEHPSTSLIIDALLCTHSPLRAISLFLTLLYINKFKKLRYLHKVIGTDNPRRFYF